MNKVEKCNKNNTCPKINPCGRPDLRNNLLDLGSKNIWDSGTYLADVGKYNKKNTCSYIDPWGTPDFTNNLLDLAWNWFLDNYVEVRFR